MGEKLTDALVKALEPPATGNTITFDSDAPGLGIRVTAKGARSFIFTYRTKVGRQRRYTIGSFPAWRTVAARQEARRLRQEVERGGDPLGELVEKREAPTVSDLCDRYIAEHLPKKRESSRKSDQGMIRQHILPALGSVKVAELEFSDIDRLHRTITDRGTPLRANRTIAVFSKMLSLSVRWKWRSDNPCRFIERNQEPRRHRYLAGAELERLTQTLAEFPDRQAANIVRLLLLTGARSGEVRSARWDQFDLSLGVWTKPAGTTKQKLEHRIPISGPARQLLSEIYAAKPGAPSDYVFPNGRGGHRGDIPDAWRAICKAADIEGARLHDLRHSYASILASAGMSLPIIGALLGHSVPTTTSRYSHLFDDPLRAAAERVGAVIAGKSSAAIVRLKGGAA